MWRRAIVALMLSTASIAALPARVAAQAVSSFDELKARVRADQTVYVRTAAIEDEHGRGVKGKVLDIQGPLLRLQVKGQPREFEQRNVLTVSERYHRGGRGALIGLAVGAGLGAWFYSANCAGSHDPESCAVADLVLGLGVGVGTLLGYEVGRSIEHERILFSRPDLRSRSLSVAPQLGPSRASLAATGPAPTTIKPKTLTVQAASAIEDAGIEQIQLEATVVALASQALPSMRVLAARDNPEAPADLRVDARIVGVDRITTKSRTVAGMLAGRARLKAEVILVDTASGATVGTFAAEGRSSYTGTTEQAIKRAAEQIVRGLATYLNP